MPRFAAIAIPRICATVPIATPPVAVDRRKTTRSNQPCVLVRYAGEKLSAEEAVNLLKAVADMKTRPLPNP